MKLPHALIEDRRFTQQLNALCADPIRADEFTEGARCLLVLNPRRGLMVLPDPDRIWMVQSRLPECLIAIFYTFDDTRVWLLAIQKM